MPTAIISDLHLGSHGDNDLLRRPEIVERLLDATADCETLVLLGDTIELRDGPIAQAAAAAAPFFERIGANFERVVLLPGNHDHRLLGTWLERYTDDEVGPELGLSEQVSPLHPALERVAAQLGEAELEVTYPGYWIRDDVFAWHGHYGDSHFNLPTIERLSVAMVDRVGGETTGERSTPYDYEKVHAPVYNLLFDLAQGSKITRQDDEGRAMSVRVWELLGGASGTARNWRGRLLGSTVVPAALRGLERFGVGSFTKDFSLAEIGRAGVEAAHDACDSLGIEAEHVIFGHIHRKGPLPGEDGRSAADPDWERRTRKLWNTGCWLYVPAMLESADSSNPFWPGRVIVVGSEGEPEIRETLADVGHDVLAAERGS